MSFRIHLRKHMLAGLLVLSIAVFGVKLPYVHAAEDVSVLSVQEESKDKTSSKKKKHKKKKKKQYGWVKKGKK